MAEKIAGIMMREIDQSQPTRVRPEGIPAGVIGTAAKGPAFVPVLFASTTDFVKEFGSSRGGEHFGPIAVAEWMKNAKAGLYLRTLGVGDGNKASSTDGTTANAGFVVGDLMRDKDRLDADYPTLETDEDVDGLAANPYAGVGLQDQLSVAAGATVATIPAVPATFETTTVAIGNADGNDDAVTATDFESMWFIVAEDSTTNIAFFLHTEPVQLDVGTGLIVEAGVGHSSLAQGTEIHDFTGSANEVITVDVTGLTLESQIVGAINTANSTTLTFDLSGVDVIVITAGTAGFVDAATSSSFAPPLVVTANGDGADLVPEVPGTQDFEFTIADATAALYDGSSITLNGAELTIGDANTFDIDLNSSTPGNNQLTVILEYLRDNYSGAITVAASTTGDVTTGTIRLVVGTTLTHFDNSPSAPKGRVHFLGCKMFSDGLTNSSTDHIQDYLDGAYTDVTKMNVLRGVLMFPAGVYPGIAETSSTISDSDVPSISWGIHGTGKDLGAQEGHLEAGVFQLILNGYTGDAPKVLKASMNPKSSNYFAKVFNTNPEDIQVKGHYLYAHYDIPRGLAVETTDSTASNDNVFCVPGKHDVNSGSDFSSSNYEPTFEIWKEKFSHASSPWIYSQKLGNGPKKLFKIHALDAGEIAFEDQFKIEISNVHQPKKGEYGTFNLKLRKLSDIDSDPFELESFSGLTLDPSSENYIGRKIGDLHTFFDFERAASKQKIVTEGLYSNKSRFIRVEIAPQVQAGQMDLSALPVGFAGKNHVAVGNGSVETITDLVEPPLPFRQKVSKSSGTNLQADSKLCWGLETMSVDSLKDESRSFTYNATAEKNAGLIYNLCKHFPSVGTSPVWVGDNRGAALVNTDQVLDADVYNNNHFSLEKILVACRKDSDGNRSTSLSADPAWWHEATYIRNGNTTFATTQGTGNQYKEVISGTPKTSANGYRYLNPAIDMVNPSNANLKYFKFVVPMQGGFNGLDIFDGDKKKMNNISSVREMSAVSDYGGTSGSTTAAFRKALDILAEKADVDIQLLAIPGMSSSGITDHAIDKTEDRFDALYIMDIPAYDQDDKLFQGVAGTHVSVLNTAKQLQDRNIDTSFAASYFPNLNMMDPYNPAISVEAPPSCAVLGAMSFNDTVSHPWYAPAGFTRGTLQTVEGGTVILDKDDLETLHVVDINPITSFANSAYDGMVVWGQKTMLQGKSALDRVNVRRLLIDIRRKVRVIANSILFEPNRESTLAAFSAQVNPILVRIQQQQGLDRFKVVIDSSTTTQQDIENNTIRGKIYLQPIKSIEFISLDFVVGNQID